MNELITQINDAIWGYVLIGGLIICGIGCYLVVCW